MQNNFNQKEIRKNYMSNKNYSSSEDLDHYKKNNLQSTRSNESKAELPKKRKNTKESFKGQENGKNENNEDLIYDNPIIKSKI